MMRLKSLRLLTFRNYERLAFTPHPHCTVLCGLNGQGKTNVIEAIALLATGRSHRQAKDRDLVQWGADGYRLDGEFAGATGALRTVLVYDGKAKRVECDDIVQERLSAVLGRTPVSIFAPDDLTLVKGGPAVRRRFLDMNLSQVNAQYLADLQWYTRTLKQRNRALQDWLRGEGERALVTLWDEQLVESGSRLQEARTHYVADLGIAAATVQQDVSGAREHLEVRYAPSVPLGASREEIAAHFRETLERLHGRERATGSTPCGPHRDDMHVALDGRPIREYGSQGQQRSIVLALKLAEGAVMQQRTPGAPITLLDDFASELDEQRQAGILETVRTRGQVIITTTVLTGPLQALADKRVVQVVQGTLCEAAS